MRASPQPGRGSRRLQLVKTIPDPFSRTSAEERYLADRRRDIVEKIDQFGVIIFYIGSGECTFPGCDHPPEPLERCFGYTVGLTELGHPELRLDGYTYVETMDILNRTFAYIAEGGSYTRMRPGQTYGLGNEDGTWSAFDIREIRHPEDAVPCAVEYYAEGSWPGPVAALRLVPR